ncbi:patatin-like phospholipase family protein [Ruminiclostridium josui]|uniref:patatin-like phospholipase family protein n=1 Tax=Ruminiclostridium josui TaxID=1499 RepID=UPI000A755C6C|nr:patatin-like phospholipase family protein [Ruminiclostridium josui]
MNKRSRIVNLVLSGGGIKGIAFVGAYEEIEKKYKRIGNIAGVSAGALVGALIGAGYTSRELGKIMKEFDFSSLTYGREITMDISIANSMRSIEQEKKSS